MIGSGDQRDLGANERPVGGVERAQRLAAGAHARVAVGIEELAGRPALSARLQIHRQKRHVAGDVGAAQLRVELDAIDHADLGCDQNVLAAQVPVPVADQPQQGTPPKLWRVSLHKRRAEEGRDVQAPSGGWSMPFNSPTFRCHSTSTRSGPPPLTTAAERWKSASRRGHRRDVRPGEGACRDQARQRVVLAKGAHLNGVLHGVRSAITDQAKSGPAPYDGAHAKIESGRKLSVDTHLLMAGATPTCKRAVVQEPQRDRLLDLVRAIARHEHPGGMRLVHRDLRVSSIHLRRRERLHQGGLLVALPIGCDLSRGRSGHRLPSAPWPDIHCILHTPFELGVR